MNTKEEKKEVYLWSCYTDGYQTSMTKWVTAKTERAAIIAAHRWCDAELPYATGPHHHVSVTKTTLDEDGEPEYDKKYMVRHQSRGLATRWEWKDNDFSL